MMSNPVCPGQSGTNSLFQNAATGILHGFLRCLILFLICRPHDQVLLDDMKADWHASLDNKVGFKVLKVGFIVYLISF